MKKMNVSLKKGLMTNDYGESFSKTINGQNRFSKTPSKKDVLINPK